MTANSKNNNHLDTSKAPNIVNRKLVFFLTCSIVFGSLSFVSYKPVQPSKNDYSVALVNNSKPTLEIVDKPISNLATEKSNSSTNLSTLSNTTNNTNVSENQFALIVGTYQEKYNAVILEKEMKKRGFKHCSIIANNNSNKYWVTVDFYKDKNEAETARERFLIDGWIKQI
jgi:mannitol-specific phosphotransferase system IIBC component